MDDQQVLELRNWAQRLSSGDRADVRAAGKAIAMLADELTALRAQQRLESDVLAANDAPPMAAQAPDPDGTDVASSLRNRLRSIVGVRDHADG
jgi:hypothetical protein